MKKKTLDTPLPLGTFRLGNEHVDLYCRAGTGGDFNIGGAKDKHGRITVGLDQCHWDQTFAVLLHEVLEYSLTRSDLRFVPGIDWSQDNGNYRFFFDHTQFSEFVARSSPFIRRAAKPLKKAWRARRKQ